MLKERNLYILLAVLFIAYVVVEYYAPKPIDWTITLSEKDKNPFGTYILYDRLKDVFTNKEISYNTLREDISTSKHLIILAQDVQFSEVDTDALFKILHEGRSVFIGAQSFSRSLLDTFGLQLQHLPFEPLLTDSISVKFNDQEYFYPSTIVNSYFNEDSLSSWKIHGEAMGPVLISKNFNKAKLILSSTPLVFTNYGMLLPENHQYVSEALQLLPYEEVALNLYYHAGKQEPKTPFRYVLSVAPLRWALHLSLLVLIFYLIVNSRRIQRMIPIVAPPENATIKFIKTIGGLYYREGNHRQAAQKITAHFMKGLSTKYHVNKFEESTFPAIAAKTGVPLEDVIHTFSLIQGIKTGVRFSEENLKLIYEKIKLFNIH